MSWKRLIEQAEKALVEKRGLLAQEAADLAKLEADYPDVQFTKDDD